MNHNNKYTLMDSTSDNLYTQPQAQTTGVASAQHYNSSADRVEEGASSGGGKSNNNNGQGPKMEQLSVENSHYLLEEDFSSRGKKKIPTKYKRLIYVLVALAIIITIVLLIVFLLPRGKGSKSNAPTKINVIMMIGDGMGPAALTLARVAFNKTSLNLDPYLVGTVKTYSSSSTITDSAAAATAYGCGVKSYNGAIGVDPNKNPVGNIIEAANLKSIKSGLVVTTRISDATPAGFFAHATSRSYESFIIDQIMEKRIQVILGGGKDYFSQSVLDQAKVQNYSYVETAAAMETVSQGNILGLFAADDIPFEIDRINENLVNIPTLADMTQKALSLLNQDNENGFFLMVEGSKIDVAAHKNDAATQIYETQAFDNAFKVALDFAKSDGQTIILVTADHETGGLTLGYQSDPSKYPDYVWYPQPLFSQTKSAVEMINVITTNATATYTMSDIIKQYTNVTMTDNEIASIQALLDAKDTSDAASLLGKLIATRCNIGWTTFGHTGVDVNLYAYDTFSFFNQYGNHNNIDVSNFISTALSIDMQEANSLIKNFVPYPTTPAPASKIQLHKL